MIEIDIEVGRRIRERRTTLGMSQTELGRLAGVKFQQIQKYETGANRVSASRLYTIAAALGVPVSHFFERVPAGDAPLPSGPGEELLQDARAVRLVRNYMRLPDDQKKVVLDMVMSMSKRIEESQEAAVET
ncbi:MAG: helix-turn-helix domain-containing protein [Rhodosalinus sp.]|uniref:helix-turn-helix domain-containing protein n=1 Tax=Rhodosalinus sp. TaxID=2047741 RepID=UPI00397E6725